MRTEFIAFSRNRAATAEAGDNRSMDGLAVTTHHSRILISPGLTDEEEGQSSKSRAGSENLSRREKGFISKCDPSGWTYQKNFKPSSNSWT